MHEDRGLHDGKVPIIDVRKQLLDELKGISSIDSNIESNDFLKFQRTESRWECGLQCIVFKFPLSEGLLIVDSIEDKDVKIKLINGLLNSSFDNPEVYEYFREHFKDYEEYFITR